MATTLPCRVALRAPTAPPPILTAPITLTFAPTASLRCLGCKSLPAGTLLSDGQTHTNHRELPASRKLHKLRATIFLVYLDSGAVLETTVDLTKQLTLGWQWWGLYRL